MRRVVVPGALILVALASTACPVGIPVAVVAVDSPPFKIKATLRELWEGTGDGVPTTSPAKIPLLPDIPSKPGSSYVKFPIADGDAGLVIPITDEVPREKLLGGTLRFFLTNDLTVPAIVHVALAVSLPYAESERAAGGAAVTVDKVVPVDARSMLAYENFAMTDLSRAGKEDAKELRLGVGMSTMGSRGTEVMIDPDAAVTVEGRIHWSVLQPTPIPIIPGLGF